MHSKWVVAGGKGRESGRQEKQCTNCKDHCIKETNLQLHSDTWEEILTFTFYNTRTFSMKIVLKYRMMGTSTVLSLPLKQVSHGIPVKVWMLHF